MTEDGDQEGLKVTFFLKYFEYLYLTNLCEACLSVQRYMITKGIRNIFLSLFYNITLINE